jgi:hypothetical protein
MTYRKPIFHVLQKQRAGLSLIEVLIGLTVTLIVLGAMAGAFRFASQEMAKGRASLEMTNRLRTIENLFRDDLRRLTVELKPYHRLPGSPQGYAEIIDGGAIDARNIADDGTTADRNESVANLLVGDIDDIFGGTIRSDGRPFRGRLQVLPTVTATIEESHLAEVVWFTTFSDIDGDGDIEPDEGDRIRLFRRQLIVKPSLGNLGANLTIAGVNQFVQNNDVSVLVQPDPDNAGRFRVVANSLEGLARRGNRFAHNQTAYPQTSTMNLVWLRSDDQYEDENAVTRTFPHRRASDQSDLLISDVAAFDIRVFAPDAVSLVKWDTAVPQGVRTIVDMALPGDLAWQIAAQTTGTGAGFNNKFYDNANASFVNETAGSVAVQRVNRTGAYVDLGNSASPGSLILSVPAGDNVTAERDVGSNPIVVVGALQSAPAVTPVVAGTQRPLLSYAAQPVFDTGTSEYNSSTLYGALPLGTNGIDDNDDGIIDGDEKLLPPYDVRIRGLQMMLRLYEPNAGQATQITLKQSMVPQ